MYKRQGTLTVEAEVRNVQHFAVKTAYLAAVVKGTRFTVTAKRSGGSVEVFRGQVSVEDKLNAETVLILAGQKATVAKSGAIKVTGKPKAGTKPGGKTTNNATPKTPGGSHASDGDDDTSGSGDPDKSDKGDKSNDTSSNTSSNVGGVVEAVTDTVETVVDTTTDTVTDVLDKTTDTVDSLAGTVDKVTSTNVVGTTVGTVTNTLDDTTRGLTGLLGKKSKGG